MILGFGLHVSWPRCRPDFASRVISNHCFGLFQVVVWNVTVVLALKKTEFRLDHGFCTSIFLNFFHSTFLCFRIIPWQIGNNEKKTCRREHREEEHDVAGRLLRSVREDRRGDVQDDHVDDVEEDRVDVQARRQGDRGED